MSNCSGELDEALTLTRKTKERIQQHGWKNDFGNSNRHTGFTPRWIAWTLTVNLVKKNTNGVSRSM